MNTDRAEGHQLRQAEAARDYLVFGVRGEWFAVEARLVRELVWLPELAPVEEAAACVVGVFDLRGRIVPVLDLSLRFGHAAQSYRAEDGVVVLALEQGDVGVVVNETRDVRSIVASQIQPPSRAPHRGHPLVAGETDLDGAIVMLLDPAEILPSAEGAAPAASRGELFPAAMRAVFHERALALRQPVVTAEAGGAALAVVTLDGEYYGIELEVVREFVDVAAVMPVPCAPAHILGAIGLRGEIIPLVDIRGLLRLAAGGTAGSKAALVQSDPVFVAVAVDNVMDVIFIAAAQIGPPPAAGAGAADYLKGVVSWNGHWVAVLDIKKALMSEALVVNEQV